MDKTVPPLEMVADFLTVQEAADLVGMHPITVRRAIRKGELDAHTPRNRNPRQLGGGGYRIARVELVRWYQGKPKETPVGDSKPG